MPLGGFLAFCSLPLRTTPSFGITRSVHCTVTALSSLKSLTPLSSSPLGTHQEWDEKEFPTWFPDYSQAWKKVLEETDQDLGLALKGGKDGGYRSIFNVS